MSRVNANLKKEMRFERGKIEAPECPESVGFKTV